MVLATIYLAYQHVDFMIFGVLLKATGYISEEMIMPSWLLLETVIKLVQARNLARLTTKDLPSIVSLFVIRF